MKIKLNRLKIKWSVSKLREFLLYRKQAWYRFTGNWILEALCGMKLCNMEAMRECLKLNNKRA